METKEPLIFQNLLSVMKEIDAIEKNKKNQQQGFNFRGIDDVMNSLHDIMAKNNVLVIPTIIHSLREEKTTKSGSAMVSSVCDYKFTFFTIDGSSLEGVVRGEAMDSGDKTSSKCLSIALKYFLTTAFMIPTEELVDPDKESHDIAPSQGKEDAVTKMLALPDDIKGFLKGKKRSDVISWCEAHEWNTNSMRSEITGE
jgi:hypothetical protein